MDTLPLVSICIPTYNRAGMIDKAIESALAQSYPNIEVIVVDNASNDGTDGVVKGYNSPRLVFYRNEKNLGLFGNFNRCIELAKGDIIHILHSDDFIDPEFTTSCVQFFLDNPTVMLTFSSSVIIINGGDEIDISYADRNEIYRAPEGFRRVLTERSFIVCPSVMMRREVYEKFGPYSLEYPYSSDLAYWLQVTRVHHIGFVRSACLYYRQGEHSESYMHLFTNVTGYLDTLKIYANLIRTLGDERPAFNLELTIALQRFIRDCFYAGFTRTDSMRDFSPSFFTGTALSAWSMIQPESAGEFLSKWGMLPVILCAGAVMGIPPLRWLVNRVFFSRKKNY